MCYAISSPENKISYHIRDLHKAISIGNNRKPGKGPMIKKGYILSMIQYLCLKHVIYLYWLMLGHLGLNLLSLPSFLTILSMTLRLYVDTIQDM